MSIPRLHNEYRALIVVTDADARLMKNKNGSLTFRDEPKYRHLFHSVL